MSQELWVIVGVLAGSGATYLGTRQANAENRLWHRRADCYAQLLAVVDEVHMIAADANRLVSDHGDDPAQLELPFDRDGWFQVSGQVEAFGHEAVRENVANLNVYVRHLLVAAMLHRDTLRNLSATDYEERQASLKYFRESKDEVIKVCRSTREEVRKAIGSTRRSRR